MRVLCGVFVNERVHLVLRKRPNVRKSYIHHFYYIHYPPLFISYIQNIFPFESLASFLIMVGFAYPFYSILLAATSVANATWSLSPQPVEKAFVLRCSRTTRSRGASEDKDCATCDFAVNWTQLAENPDQSDCRARSFANDIHTASSRFDYHQPPSKNEPVSSKGTWLRPKQSAMQEQMPVNLQFTCV